MKSIRRVTIWMLALLMVSGMAFTAPAALADTGKAEASFVEGVKLISLTSEIGKYKGVDSLIFKVAIKNTSAQPQRFRVNIFLDNGKAVGGLIPRKGKPPVLKPGQEAKASYPVKGQAAQPQKITIMIKKAGY